MQQLKKVSELITILLIGTLLLSIIGLYNGYPLVYSDTGTYIYSGFDTFIPLDRPITYGLFLKFFSFEYSTWFVVVFQNLLTAIVLYKTLKLFFDNNERFKQIYYSVIFFLVVFTGIGWYSNQLMPDFFAPIALLTVFIFLHEKKTVLFSKGVLILILIYALITHFSHLLIATTLVGTIILCKIIFKQRLAHLSFKKIILVSAVVLSSWIILPLINYVVEKQFILSKGSHVFVMAHLNDTGILKKFLTENCSNAEFKDCKLCHYKDSLPTDLADFIWSGNVFEKTGGWENSKEEYDKIIFATIKRPKYLFLNMYRSVSYGLIQLTKNEIGQGLSAYTKGSPPYGQISWWFNSELNNYLNSRQNKWNGENLKLDLLNTIHLIIILISILIVILLFTSSILTKIDTGSVCFLIFSILAITINSFITAGLNSPCERFQARVIWLLPFSILVLIIKNYKIIIKTIQNIHSPN